MPKDTKTLGNNKARACESLGFVHKKRLCQRFDTTSSLPFNTVLTLPLLSSLVNESIKQSPFSPASIVSRIVFPIFALDRKLLRATL